MFPRSAELSAVFGENDERTSRMQATQLSKAIIFKEKKRMRENADLLGRPRLLVVRVLERDVLDLQNRNYFFGTLIFST